MIFLQEYTDALDCCTILLLRAIYFRILGQKYHTRRIYVKAALTVISHWVCSKKPYASFISWFDWGHYNITLLINDCIYVCFYASREAFLIISLIHFDYNIISRHGFRFPWFLSTAAEIIIYSILSRRLLHFSPASILGLLHFRYYFIDIWDDIFLFPFYTISFLWAITFKIYVTAKNGNMNICNVDRILQCYVSYSMLVKLSTLSYSKMAAWIMMSSKYFISFLFLRYLVINTFDFELFFDFYSLSLYIFHATIYI